MGRPISPARVHLARRGQKWRPNAPTQTQISSAWHPRRPISGPKLRLECVSTDMKRTRRASPRRLPRPHPAATQPPPVVLFMMTTDNGPMRQPVEASFFNHACGGVDLINFSRPHLAPTTPFASSPATANPSAPMGLFGSSNGKGKGNDEGNIP